MIMSTQELLFRVTYNETSFPMQFSPPDQAEGLFNSFFARAITAAGAVGRQDLRLYGDMCGSVLLNTDDGVAAYFVWIMRNPQQVGQLYFVGAGESIDVVMRSRTPSPMDVYIAQRTLAQRLLLGPPNTMSGKRRALRQCSKIIPKTYSRMLNGAVRLFQTGGRLVAERMASTMNAIVVRQFGPPEVMKLEHVPVPDPGQNEVLVRIHAAGVNPVDTYIRNGAYPFLPLLPYSPGKEAAGVVQAVGDGVHKVKIGDRVFCRGDRTYAEYAVFSEAFCYTLPDRLSFGQGAGIGVPYFTAYRALFQIANGRPSHTILIHGASGGVGLAAVQLAKARGMTVFGTAGTEDGMKLVRENGASHAFNHRMPGYTDQLMKATDGKGFDVIIEVLANVNLGKDIEMVKQNGVVVVVGSRGAVEINPRPLMTKNASVRGMSLAVPFEQCNWDDMAAALTAGLENGTLTPVVDREYPLEKAADAHRDIVESAGAKGKLVLRMVPA